MFHSSSENQFTLYLLRNNSQEGKSSHCNKLSSTLLVSRKILVGTFVNDDILCCLIFISPRKHSTVEPQ